MEFSGFLSGFQNSLSLGNLWYCFLGCLLGTFVGVLPGLGPATTLSILLPICLYLPPTGAIIMMAGLFYGAMYGGSTTSILINLPGEAASVVTILDGYEMTRRGRAGEALAIAAIGSFIAGVFGAAMVALLGVGLAKYALRFGPPEYTGLVLFSMTMVISLSGASLTKAILAALGGVFLATVGADSLTGTPRLSFGITDLSRGVYVIPVVVGLYGVGEILTNVQAKTEAIYTGKLGRMIPRGAELKRGILGSIQGTISGFIFGLLPGMSPTITAFIAYDIEKRISKHPEKFGTGVIEGVSAPEAANNASVMAGFIPLLALGIPTTPTFAVMLTTLTIHGLQLGPMLFQQNSLFVWTLIASMVIGNAMLLFLNLPLVGLWARLCLVPFKFLAPVVLAVSLIGTYAVRNTMFDVWLTILFGVLGFIMKRTEWPTTPLILGFILGDMLEGALRQSLASSAGSLLVFVNRPISLSLIIITILTLVVMYHLRRRASKSTSIVD